MREETITAAQTSYLRTVVSECPQGFLRQGDMVLMDILSGVHEDNLGP